MGYNQLASRGRFILSAHAAYALLRGGRVGNKAMGSMRSSYSTKNDERSNKIIQRYRDAGKSLPFQALRLPLVVQCVVRVCLGVASKRLLGCWSVRG